MGAADRVRSGPPLFAIVTFWAFVLGGLAFGVVFVMNWRTLGAQVAQGSQPPPMVSVGAGPMTVNVPVPVHQPAPVALPNKPSDVSTGLVNVVRSALPDWQGTQPITIVLLGIDKRDDEPIAGTRTDTIILALIDPVAKSAAMVSLPRDMWVRIPGCTAAYGCINGQQRINVAHAVGGPDMTRETIAAGFGIRPDFYARVDFRGFEQLVNLAGGVVIDVERPVKDDEYPTADYGYQRIYFGPGPQLMDGATALEYARSRHGTSDFSRAGRQQQVILSLRNRALQMNMLVKAPEMLGVVQKSLATDLSPVQMLSIAKLLSQIDRDHIANLVIDSNYVTPFTGQDGADLLSPNVPAIRAAIAGAQRSAAHPELRARIEVLNGTGTAGLGQRAADYLTARGFNVVRVAAADRGDYRASLVQVMGADRRAAEALASALSVSPDVITDAPASGAAADIRVVLGQDFRVPQTS